jgi:hypothetical protein
MGCYYYCSVVEPSWLDMMSNMLASDLHERHMAHCRALSAQRLWLHVCAQKALLQRQHLPGPHDLPLDTLSTMPGLSN